MDAGRNLIEAELKRYHSGKTVRETMFGKKPRRRSRYGLAAIWVAAIAGPLLCVASAADRLAAQSPPPAAVKRSGYALSPETCGAGPLAFPKLRIGMRSGYCTGLVASESDGLIFPRSIVQIPGSDLFVVADMGGWGANLGRLWLLDPGAPQDKRLKRLVANLDLPHGLAIGIDRRVYASTIDKVFRFDPLTSEPEKTVEVIIQGLPGRQPRLPNGTLLTHNLHPLKQFIFDKTGRIYINVGAPTDNCATQRVESKPCLPGEGATPFGAVWAFTPPAGGIFPALKAGDRNPPLEIYARGLRNSMALAAHRDFPGDGFALLQAENARDLPDLTKPNEELNVLEPGKHYGWPYCYDLATESPEYRAFLASDSPYRKLCANTASYRQPHSLLPPHAAPLSMFYYGGDKFPELRDKLVVGLHGYQPTGSRVIFYDVDAKGLPSISPAPVHYNVSCANPPAKVFRTEQQPQVPAAAFRELMSQWYRVDGVRPQGAPVGITVASDGAIWLVEDKNKTVLRIDADTTSAALGMPSCNSRTEAEIKQLIGLVTTNTESLNRLTQVRVGLIEKHCRGCHSDFGLKDGQSPRQKDEALLRFWLSQDGWLVPGKPTAGRLHIRTWGEGAENIMPANGRELLAGDPEYRKLLETLDMLVDTMAPGARPPVRR